MGLTGNEEGVVDEEEREVGHPADDVQPSHLLQAAVLAPATLDKRVSIFDPNTVHKLNSKEKQRSRDSNPGLPLCPLIHDTGGLGAAYRL